MAILPCSICLSFFFLFSLLYISLIFSYFYGLVILEEVLQEILMKQY